MTDQALLTDFLSDQSALARRSTHTVQKSQEVVSRFLRFLAEHQLTLTEADSQGELAPLAVQWLQGVRAKGTKPGSLHLYLVELCEFFRKLKAFGDYAVACQYLPENPMSDLRIQRQRLGRTRVLTVPETERLLQQPDLNNRMGLRDSALLTFLYTTGARPSEVAAADRSDIVEDLFHVRHGKKSRQRFVPIPSAGLERLQLYLSARRDEHPALFVGLRKQRLSPNQITQVVKDHARQAGLGDEVTAMTLRHCYGSHLVEAGMEPETVALLMGHRSLEETSVYVHVTLEDQRRELEKLPSADPDWWGIDWDEVQRTAKDLPQQEPRVGRRLPRRR